MPPRHLKSFVCSIAYPAWLLGKYPHLRIMIVVGNVALRNELSAKLTDLMCHPRYQSLFPHLNISCNGNIIHNGFQGAVEFYLVNQSMVGKGADVIVIDDPLSPKHATDSKHLSSTNNWYDENVFQRLNNKSKGVVILTMQRLSENDLIAHVQQQEEWDILRYQRLLNVMSIKEVYWFVQR